MLSGERRKYDLPLKRLHADAVLNAMQRTVFRTVVFILSPPCNQFSIILQAGRADVKHSFPFCGFKTYVFDPPSRDLGRSAKSDCDNLSFLLL
jgi:hypothetical protein